MQHVPPAAADAAVEVQPVGPAVQRQMGLIVPDGDVQSGDVPGGNVGGIAHQTVKIPQPGRRIGQSVHLQGHHLPAETVAADILAADPQGPLVQLPQHHPCAGDLTGDGQTDAAGAGAQIQHPALRQGPQPRCHVVHQRLRVRTGDQHAFGDVQRQPVELPLPDEVGHRLPRQMAAHQIPRPLLDGRGDIQLPIPHQLAAGLAGGEAHQLTGLQRGGLDACPAESLPDIHIQIVVSSRHNTLRCHILSFSGENGREFLTSGPCPPPPAAPASRPQWPPPAWSRPAR